jgi:nucleoside-diphosphate-sugar epimerase
MAVDDRRLIVGCGDVGLRLAKRLLAQDRPVRANVRSHASAEALRAQGLDAEALDLDQGHALPPASEVWWFAPPPAQGRTDPRLRGWLDTTPDARRIVYISTSGVYGDCGGRWIDEDEPLKPQTDRGQRRLDAENALRDFAARSGVQVVILRVPGIYGPGRLPHERLQRGLPVVREDECPWTNRIHAEDLAEVALGAMTRGAAGAAYNVSDGNPTTMTDYFTRCARLLGLPEPPRVTLAEARAQFTPAMLSFLEESKRLVNRRMREELGVRLRYPDLATGLPACLD